MYPAWETLLPVQGQEVSGPTATKHPSMGHRMDTGPGGMVQDWDGAVLGMVPAGP